MQIRTTSRYLVTVVRMVTIRNLDTMLEWMWRKGNPPILFVRMKTDTATMENSVEMSLKTGSKTTTCCAVLVAQLCPTLRNPMDCGPPGYSAHGDSPGKNTKVGCHARLQGIFPIQGSKLVSRIAGRSVIV